MRVAKTPKKTGRPSKRTDAICDEIMADIAKGITLSEICRRDHMPARVTIYEWMEDDAELSKRFASAREAGFDVIAEDCLDIAEDGSNDWMERKNADGSLGDTILNGEHVQRSKLRIDTRLKLLAKWDPKRFGDKQEIAHTGAVSIIAQPQDDSI